MRRPRLEELGGQLPSKGRASASRNPQGRQAHDLKGHPPLARRTAPKDEERWFRRARIFAAESLVRLWRQKTAAEALRIRNRTVPSIHCLVEIVWACSLFWSITPGTLPIKATRRNRVRRNSKKRSYTSRNQILPLPRVQDGNNTKSRLATLLRGCGRERQAGDHCVEAVWYPIRHSRRPWVDTRLASRQIQTQNR